MPKWQAWDPRTIRYAKEQISRGGGQHPGLVGGLDLLESNLDIHILHGQAENNDPFVVVVSAGVDPAARRRIRTDGPAGRYYWESCAAPAVFQTNHPYIRGILREQRRQLLWRWPLLEDGLPCHEDIHYGEQRMGLSVPYCGNPAPPTDVNRLRPR